MNALNLSEIQKTFGSTRVLDNVSLTVEKGEFVTLLGPSGCGKTTLLRLIAGLESADKGQISIGGSLVEDKMKRVLVKPQHRRLGYVFQDYALWPHMTVFQNLAFPLEMLKTPKEEIAKAVTRVLGIVKLTEHVDKRPEQLSGGQQQRVSIARAIVANPEIILFDEPLSNLDANLRESVGLEIKMLAQNLNLTCINVTHDRREAQILSDRIALLNGGRIHQVGTPESIFRQPIDSWAAEFMDTGSMIQGSKAFAEIENQHGTFCVPAVAVTIGSSGPNNGVAISCRFISDRYEVSLDIIGGVLRCYSDCEVAIGETIRFSINVDQIIQF